nr:MAG TPA: hypothetical protein [Bacteriophage sp.]
MFIEYCLIECRANPFSEKPITANPKMAFTKIQKQQTHLTGCI